MIETRSGVQDSPIMMGICWWLRQMNTQKAHMRFLVLLRDDSQSPMEKPTRTSTIALKCSSALTNLSRTVSSEAIAKKSKFLLLDFKG